MARATAGEQTTVKRATNDSLQIERRLRATPSELYHDWTDPERIKAWLAPADEMRTIIHEQELEKGGHYRMSMERDDDTYMFEGVYDRLDLEEGITMSWNWTDGVEHPEDTMLDVRFHDHGDGTTTLTIEQTNLRNKASVEEHLEGWRGCLERLAKLHPFT